MVFYYELMWFLLYTALCFGFYELSQGMFKPSSSVQYNYLFLTNFSRGNHGHSCTLDLPTVRREGATTCHLIGERGVVRIYAKCIVFQIAE